VSIDFYIITTLYNLYKVLSVWTKLNSFDDLFVTTVNTKFFFFFEIRSVVWEIYDVTTLQTSSFSSCYFVILPLCVLILWVAIFSRSGDPGWRAKSILSPPGQRHTCVSPYRSLIPQGLWQGRWSGNCIESELQSEMRYLYIWYLQGS